MRTVETQNSTYEIDTVHRRIRRTTGSAAPTTRQGPDNVWKPYADITKVMGGYLIDWDGEGHCTLTSPIVRETESGTPGKGQDA
jgi:hypothetical protein